MTTRNSLPWSPKRCLGLLALSALVVAFSASQASARGRGGWGYQRQFQRAFQQQMKVMQKQMQTMQAQQKAEYDAFMNRFDTNKNGVIDGKERGPAQKYLRDIENGKDPDRAINNLSRSRKSTSRKSSSKSSKEKRSSDKPKDKNAASEQGKE